MIIVAFTDWCYSYKLSSTLKNKVYYNISWVLKSQRNCVLDLLTKTGMFGSKPVDTPIDPNTKLIVDQGELLDNLEMCKRLVGCVATSTDSQVLDSPQTSHWEVVIRILLYLKNAPSKSLLY